MKSVRLHAQNSVTFRATGVVSLGFWLLVLAFVYRERTEVRRTALRRPILAADRRRSSACVAVARADVGHRRH